MSLSSLLIKDCYIVTNGFTDLVDVLIEDGIIKEIGRSIGDRNLGDIPIILSKGMYLTPGLIDCHVHLILDGSPDIVGYVASSDLEKLSSNAVKNSIVSLENGITTVRDMGCTGFIVPRLRDKIQKGVCRGPRIYAAGHMIIKKGGHVKYIGREINGTSNDLKKAVRQQIIGGADFIKLIVSGGLLSSGSPRDTELNEMQINVAVEEASRHGFKTAVHVYGDEDTRAALEAGVWTIEHGSWASIKTLKKAASSDIFLVPTLKAANNIVENADTLPDKVVRNAYEMLDAANNVLPKAVKKGVSIAMGTDAGTPYNYHGDNALELEYLSEIGMSNSELINAATVNASRVIGQGHSLGQVKPGFIADLLLLDTNPLDDIKAFRKGLKYVIQNGEIIRKPG
jgi:imidazolonepropionase-like amidohydrolase